LLVTELAVEVAVFLQLSEASLDVPFANAELGSDSVDEKRPAASFAIRVPQDEMEDPGGGRAQPSVGN